ncbi:uncharacterized protein BDW43DRAFT_231894 [Aspergillus alliaceus]|uniref:uncharacterized protein n=1 Tax=Petromyces alliaceus TaxID=209559 RepID=UPI0012A454E4|nr:uncharacterized protein BDW43DRAFT_231894 [Aspergillus alliaceus]KAB8228128.1 hypothetical protein BDW43DRAFT_231894 [Aspergillus alliaceus]
MLLSGGHEMLQIFICLYSHKTSCHSRLFFIFILWMISIIPLFVLPSICSVVPGSYSWEPKSYTNIGVGKVCRVGYLDLYLFSFQFLSFDEFLCEAQSDVWAGPQ